MVEGSILGLVISNMVVEMALKSTTVAIAKATAFIDEVIATSGVATAEATGVGFADNVATTSSMMTATVIVLLATSFEISVATDEFCLRWRLWRKRLLLNFHCAGSVLLFLWHLSNLRL